MLTLGLDDAGRGPVIGPMVLAGCLLTEEAQKELKKVGVKDSKQLTPKRRDSFVEKIKQAAETFEIVIVYPKEIDGALEPPSNLNLLEAKKMAKIINKINKGFGKIKVVIDCPSVNISKWKDFLKTNIENLSNLEVVCEHKADKNYTAVAAASILAKDIREKEVTKLKEKYGKEIGSGYCSDPTTCKFLEKYAEKHKDDGIFRKSWITWKKAFEKLGQKKLF